jgi:ComF family protein
MHRLASAVDRALDLAFPAICPGCRREGDPICHSCLASLEPHLTRPAGVPIGAPAAIPAPLLQLEWVAPYGTLLRRAIHILKYGGEQRLARPLGRALADRWQRAGRGGQLVVPVPIHQGRRRERGYDQAELLARAMGADGNLPVVQALERRRSTARQFALDRSERRANVEGAFAVAPAAVGQVADRWVVLVDDVVTTGATLGACATALRAAGALAVSAIAVAHER